PWIRAGRPPITPRRLFARPRKLTMTRPMIGPAIHKASVASSVDFMRASFLLGSGCRFECRRSPPRRCRDDDPARARQQSDEENCAARRRCVGAEAGEQGAENEAEVAPEAVDADDAGAVTWLRRIGDGRGQGRIDEGGADPE